MKHPLWIVNSILFLLTLVALGFIYFSRVHVPAREDIEPTPYNAGKKKHTLQINIAKIYENDLFGTYVKEAPAITEPTYIVQFPEPPKHQEVEIPELPVPQFLDPLAITLKGIFVITNDASKNRTIIADNKTGKEMTLKAGDMIEDAQLIRIFSNKIILLRTNGQQEVLYLREQDAKQDTAYALIDGWEQVVQDMGQDRYLINPKAFLLRIQDLAQFIDLLGITTAYKQGKSIGCRIGHVTKGSFGALLGLQSGDIMVDINGIPATNTENRFKIYQQITDMHENDMITVQLLRNKKQKTILIKLHELLEDQTPAKESLQKLQEEEKLNILKQKYEFAPTVHEIRKREKENMIQKSTVPINK